MKKTAFFLMVIVWPFAFACAQKKFPSGPLKIGDHVPDLRIRNIINYKTNTVKLSDFKNKLVILDFWTTHCGPCIAAMPKMDSLQNLFAGKLLILAVTSESKDVVEKFIKTRRAHGKNYTLPTVTGDSLLERLFPHHGVPDEVWIGPDGKMVAQTDDFAVNARNIRNVLGGEKITFRMKNESISADPGAPLLFEGNGTPADMLFHSVLTKRIHGIDGAGVESYHDSLVRAHVANSSIVSLYVFAVNRDNIQTYSINRVVFEGVTEGNKLRYDLPIDIYFSDRERFENWADANNFCYELIIPRQESDTSYSSMKARIKKVMLAHLNSFFGSKYGTHGELGIRTKKCLVLKKLGGASFEKKGSGESSYESLPTKLVFHSSPFQEVTRVLNICNDNLATPIIADKDLDGVIDMELPDNCLRGKIPELTRELNKYGLDLEEELVPIEVLVISENKN